MKAVYVASGLENAEQARAVAQRFVERGWRWTYDWTKHGSVQHLGPERIAQVAALEAGGVLVADIVVALLPGGRGTHAEIGIALGAGKPVLLVAQRAADFADASGRHCAFYHHPLVHMVVLDDGDYIEAAALGWLLLTRGKAPQRPPESRGEALARAVEEQLRRAPPSFTRRLAAALVAYRAPESDEPVRLELDEEVSDAG